jgi:kynurenine formamidase
MRILDLSIALSNSVVTDPPSMKPTIRYSDHQAGVAEFMELFPGVTADKLPGKEGPAIERVEITTHNGTHLDAPYHFNSTMDGGKRALTIDEVPLEWCFGDGVKLDFRDKPDGYVCGPHDVEQELARIGYRLKPMDIVLVNTAAGAAYGGPDFVDRGCGMGREATLFLLRQGVKVTGTDGWSWDAPFSFTRKRFAETKNAGLIWEGHFAGREIGYCHLEKLTNLDKLPPFGFKVCCFPVKVEKGSAGWTRAVAFLD